MGFYGEVIEVLVRWDSRVSLVEGVRYVAPLTQDYTGCLGFRVWVLDYKDLGFRFLVLEFRACRYGFITQTCMCIYIYIYIYIYLMYECARVDNMGMEPRGLLTGIRKGPFNGEMGIYRD